MKTKRKEAEKILRYGYTIEVKELKDLAGKGYVFGDILNGKLRKADLPIFPKAGNEQAIETAKRNNLISESQANEMSRSDFIVFGFLAVMQAQQFDNKKFYIYES